MIPKVEGKYKFKLITFHVYTIQMLANEVNIDNKL